MRCNHHPARCPHRAATWPKLAAHHARWRTSWMRTTRRTGRSGWRRSITRRTPRTHLPSTSSTSRSRIPARPARRRRWRGRRASSTAAGALDVSGDAIEQQDELLLLHCSGNSGLATPEPCDRMLSSASVVDATEDAAQRTGVTTRFSYKGERNRNKPRTHLMTDASTEPRFTGAPGSDDSLPGHGAEATILQPFWQVL